MADMLLNVFLFVVTVYIFVFSFRKEGQWRAEYGMTALRFFTMQSNLLCAASALCICFFPENRAAWLLKYAGTAAVTVTMLTVFLFLAPSVGKDWVNVLLKGPSFFLHLLNPLVALVSFCVLEKRGMSFPECLAGLVPVVLYGPLYIYKIRFAPEDKRWKDFYGFNKGGKWPLAFAAMFAATLLLCLGFMGLQNL